MAKVKAFHLSGCELEMYTNENVNEPPHFNLRITQRGLELKVWILTSMERSLDFKIIRPKNLRSARKPLDGQAEKTLGKLIETHRDALLKQWNDQIKPQQQRDLERR